MDLNDPVAAALAISRAFRDAGATHALYGGLALAAYGEPRETRDVDLAVLSAEPAIVVEILRRAGLECEVSFALVTFGGLVLSRLALSGSPQDAGLNVLDLVQPRSDRYARVALGRSVTSRLRDEPVVLLTPEDFVVFKVLSSRDRDVLDAASVVRRNPGSLDLPLIGTTIGSLATELPDHDLLGRWSRVQAARPEA